MNEGRECLDICVIREKLYDSPVNNIEMIQYYRGQSRNKPN